MNLNLHFVCQSISQVFTVMGIYNFGNKLDNDLKVSWFRNAFLGSSILTKNERKIRIYYYGTSIQTVFTRFFGRKKTPKRHFEINWPLANMISWFLSISSYYSGSLLFGSFFQVQPIYQLPVIHYSSKNFHNWFQ